MNYKSFHQYKISQLALGTIQLGMDYGIANTGGAPARDKAFGLLDFARKSGINTFDTARTYGEAEEVLGEYFRRHGNNEELVVSKFKYDWLPKITIDQAWTKTEASAVQSLGFLNTARIPLMMYHKGREEPMEEVLRLVPVMMERLLNAGYIRHAGISLYSSDDAVLLPEDSIFEAIQIPLNIFDQKEILSGTLKKLHKAGMAVFVRSVFLQGLFFRAPEQLNGVLSKAVPYLKGLHELARQYNRSVAEIAFSFIRDLPEADSLVIGAENQHQVESNLQLLGTPPLPAELTKSLQSLITDMPKEVITPGCWHA